MAKGSYPEPMRMGRSDRQQFNNASPEAADQLVLGREAYEERAWDDAYRFLARVDEATSLAVDDLERLAMSAYLTGRDDEYLRALERTHHAYLDAGRCQRAARCAFWLGLRLVFRGEMAPAKGWFGRAHRLLEREQHECVEQGYLMLPHVEQNLAAGNFEAAYAAASGAVEIGEHFADVDLVACARHLQGRVLLRQQRTTEGFALLDEAMVSVTAGELSPLLTGLIYCSVIEACQQVHALGRAREWTSALGRWCSEQPQLISFSGTCLMHRAEIMRISGAWQDAVDEAQNAVERLTRSNNRKDTAGAWYQLAEVHRLRGDFDAAEQAYRSASQYGLEPQPGLALLRLAKRHTDAAAATIRRVMDTTADQVHRIRLLPAHVEIMLAADHVEEAQRACRELENCAEAYGTELLMALATHARGAVELAEGEAQPAAVRLRQAIERWQQVDAPYEAARVRVMMGLAFRALGDSDGAALELQAAGAVFQQLGAVPDLSRVDTLLGMCPDETCGLSARELQVLRLVASGKTNKQIANDLHLSGKTVDRHVSNIFNKLDVPTRTAATAWAYEHRLI
ncbi:helix-turn-helix transcriptional regulator [Chelativorans sp. M5D2P16]|uniref:helix-turn-helix transcriptional regulator n=1 Tax=Chelativorans sp. M5D2P16 TaxID=3095678 RepID=UPI002ACAD054|nr:LuxR C-terminal-related transcriptional regulator [Chelativorans sp. M5D2P16]MDZ5698736.1 LuxR C-terminal-related transcriptional regulator [Chelativorans sp. M5D2P16]